MDKKDVKGLVEMNELLNKFNDRRTLWTHLESFQNYQAEWYHGNFTGLDSELIEKEMKKFDQTIVQLRARLTNLLSKEATEDAVFRMHQVRVNTF